jgi:hypothetical protein
MRITAAGGFRPRTAITPVRVRIPRARGDLSMQMTRRTSVAVGSLLLGALGGAPREAGAGAIPPAFAATAASYGAPADFDCDQHADISRRVHTGAWEIDLSGNGFGLWDMRYFGYGDSTAVPVPADYDGDCRADLSVKDWNGYWYIDYARDGFGAWNEIHPGYGAAAAVPVPADYDNDLRADLSVKGDDGCWFIDYASDGFGAWNAIYCGYGGAAAVPVPADYDGDRRADLSVKGDDGCWFIDYASDGFGAWNGIHCGYGNAAAWPVPADYDADGAADLAVTGPDSRWYIDYAADGFGAWNAIYANYSAPNVYSKNEPLPADYDGDRRADPALHSLDEFWYVDFSTNGLGNTSPFDVRQALGPAVTPKLTLVSRTAHSLKVRADALGPNAYGQSSSEQIKVTVNGVTTGNFGTSHTRQLTNLASDTQYCFTAKAINFQGNSTLTRCFRTLYEPPPPPPPASGISRIDVFNCHNEGHTVHLWLFDFALGTWEEKGTLAAQWGSNTCPGSAEPFAIELADGHNFRMVAVDPERTTCGGENDPQNGGCQDSELWGTGLSSAPAYRFLID